jgi:hypothetical protein
MFHTSMSRQPERTLSSSGDLPREPTGPRRLPKPYLVKDTKADGESLNTAMSQPSSEASGKTFPFREKLSYTPT